MEKLLLGAVAETVRRGESGGRQTEGFKASLPAEWEQEGYRRSEEIGGHGSHLRGVLTTVCSCFYEHTVTMVNTNMCVFVIPTLHC